MSGLQTSHLKCPKCEEEFDLIWLPGDFFQVGIVRYVKCPHCGKRSGYDIYDSIVDPNTHHCDTTVGPL